MKLIAAFALLFVAGCCAPEAPPPVPAPPQKAMSFRVVEYINGPCRLTCGSGTCLFGYDRQDQMIFNCDIGLSDVCLCAD